MFIVLTGFPDVALAVDFMKKKDVVDYLTKPVEKAKLIAAVEQATQGRKLFGRRQAARSKRKRQEINPPWSCPPPTSFL
jgi:FixJ family two-component response regulator